jgi:hypothetical protein
MSVCIQVECSTPRSPSSDREFGTAFIWMLRQPPNHRMFPRQNIHTSDGETKYAGIMAAPRYIDVPRLADVATCSKAAGKRVRDLVEGSRVVHACERLNGCAQRAASGAYRLDSRLGEWRLDGCRLQYWKLC